MPSKSKSQQRLFGMAHAVRNGDLKRSEVSKEVLDIVDSDMTDKEIEDFAKRRTSDRERVVKEDMDITGMDRIKNANVKQHRIDTSKKSDAKLTPIENYISNLMYAGRMKPIATVRPDTRYVFVVIKPGFSKLSKYVIDEFTDNGFTLYKTHTKMLTKREARQMYYVHKDEDFYDALCEYMSSDFSIGLLFSYPNNWTEKKAFELTAQIKDEIRNKKSESDMRNVLHSSDSIENMRVECAKYFNELI